MNAALSSSELSKDTIKSLLRGTAKKKADAVFKSFENSSIQPDKKLKMTIASTYMEEFDEHISRIELEMAIQATPHGFLR